MHHEGEGVPRDLKKAARWTRKAAGQGHAIAQFQLALNYRDGQGVSQDLKEAMRWCQKAADQGQVDAQKSLATMIRESMKADPNPKEVARSDGNLTRQCAFCGVDGTTNGLKLKPCSRCKIPFYCGVECQRAHWKEGHKAICTPKT
jgi:hypothetical protein